MQIFVFDFAFPFFGSVAKNKENDATASVRTVPPVAAVPQASHHTASTSAVPTAASASVPSGAVTSCRYTLYLLLSPLATVKHFSLHVDVAAHGTG